MKVVRFHPGDVGAVRPAWSGALDEHGAPGVPTRVTWATPLTGDGLPSAPFEAVEVTWWDGAPPPRGLAALDDHLRSLDPDLAAVEATVVVAVEEVVGRGADALAMRWAAGGPQPKMMSVGRRAPGLSREGFAERWRREAGTLGGERIPDEVRGLAYVQDHPVAPDDPAFDAINEVWFASVDDLRARAAWLAARTIPADLMDPATCATLCLVEDVLTT